MLRLLIRVPQLGQVGVGPADTGRDTGPGQALLDLLPQRPHPLPEDGRIVLLPGRREHDHGVAVLPDQRLAPYSRYRGVDRSPETLLEPLNTDLIHVMASDVGGEVVDVEGEDDLLP